MHRSPVKKSVSSHYEVIGRVPISVFADADICMISQWTENKLIWLRKSTEAIAGGKSYSTCEDLQSERLHSRTRMPRQRRTSLIRHQESKSSRWFFAKQCTDRTGDSGFVNAVPGTPYPLSDGSATFTFPPISESLVLRKLLRLRPIKATADSLFCNRFLQKCAPFLASSITFVFSLSLPTSSFPSAWKLCKGHPSVQTPRQPVRSVQLPANITLSSDREIDGRHPKLPSLTFHYIQQVNLHASVWVCSPKINSTSTCLHCPQMDLHSWQQRAVLSDFHGFHESFWPAVARWSIAQACTMWGLIIQPCLDLQLLIWPSHHRACWRMSICTATNLGRCTTRLASRSRTFRDLHKRSPLQYQPGAHRAVCRRRPLAPSSPTQPMQDVSLLPLQEAVTSAENWAISWLGRFGHAKTERMTSGSLTTILPTACSALKMKQSTLFRVRSILALFSPSILTGMTTSINFFWKQLHVQGF